MGLLSEVFRNPANLDKLTGTGAIGHVRYATAGEASVDNIQPFLFRFHDMQFGLAHNGNLTNAASLKKELEERGAIFSATSDSEILAHLIRRSHNPSLMGKIKEALSLVKGGFAYILLFEDKLIAALDPNGFRPLSIGKMANGAVVVSSETCAFEVIGAEWIRDLKPGEIVIIDDKGIQYDSYTDDTQLAICSMEYIYFARPDSNIHGVNVHTARNVWCQWRVNSSMKRILWSVCPILPSAQPWDLRKSPVCQMKWVLSRTNTPNVPLSNRLKNCGSKGCG